MGMERIVKELAELGVTDVETEIIKRKELDNIRGTRRTNFLDTAGALERSGGRFVPTGYETREEWEAKVFSDTRGLASSPRQGILDRVLAGFRNTTKSLFDIGKDKKEFTGIDFTPGFSKRHWQRRLKQHEIDSRAAKIAAQAIALDTLSRMGNPEVMSGGSGARQQIFQPVTTNNVNNVGKNVHYHSGLRSAVTIDSSAHLVAGQRGVPA